MSWLVTRSVLLAPLLARIASQTRLLNRPEKPVVASSRQTSDGEETRTIASVRRRRIPPESAPALLSACPASPTSPSTWSVDLMFGRSALGVTPRMIATWSRTMSCGQYRSCWGTTVM